MNDLPVSVSPQLRRLARRLALGLVLDVWPAWAAGGLLLAGLVALACRLFVPAAALHLRWLWLVPLVSLVPALIVCARRAYRHEDVAALADWLSGGHGLLLTLTECPDRRWAHSPLVECAAAIAMPRLRPWRRLAPIVPAAAFLTAALWLPQRAPAPRQAPLARDIADDLSSTLETLVEQSLVTEDEEQALEQEIERIRRAADERVDASAWEAADALRERMADAVAGKHDAVQWARESLRRFAEAAEGGGGSGQPDAQAEAELAQALERLAKSGLLANAPPELQKLLGTGTLPEGAQARAELMQALAQYLDGAGSRFSEVAALGREFGRFDPSEFPLESGAAADGDGQPGAGGVNRGRGDAPLTYGQESLPLDRFKASALPPGAARSPDDWAPVVELPGAPGEAPVLSTAAAARQYSATAGQAAWRRSLAPRHQSAVKRYFAQQK
jgi:hypothetical protein